MFRDRQTGLFRAVLPRLLGVALPAVLCTSAGSALAAEGARFPMQPMRMLVGFAPGSLTDILARTVGQKMTDTWGQQVVVGRWYPPPPPLWPEHTSSYLPPPGLHCVPVEC